MSIQQDILQLQSNNKNPQIPYRAQPFSKIDDNHNWHGILQGIKDSPYQGGKFLFSINFPSTYPNDPFSIRFSTKIFHPNVLENGRICLEKLRKECWSPDIGVVKVLDDLKDIIKSPNLDANYQPLIAHMFKNKREDFDKIAKEWTCQYAM